MITVKMIARGQSKDSASRRFSSNSQFPLHLERNWNLWTVLYGYRFCKEGDMGLHQLSGEEERDEHVFLLSFDRSIPVSHWSLRQTCYVMDL